MENRKIVFKRMPHNKKQDTEKAEQKKSIEYFGRFGCPVITHFMIGSIPVIQGKQRLNNSGNPEKTHKPRNEHEHFPLTYISTGKMAFGKNNADNQKH
jgi:hypothetical protein